MNPGIIIFTKCICCKQVYTNDWYSMDDKFCYFCNHFSPSRDTRELILEIMTASDMRTKENSKECVKALDKWCEHWRIPI